MRRGQVMFRSNNETIKPEKDTDIMNTENGTSKQDQQSTPIPAAQAAPSPANRPVAYPGAYPGAASSAYAAQGANDTSASSNNRLVISKGITLSGEIESCEHLIVEGTVEAALKGASILEIAETGAFYGTVEIDQATVAGQFEGDLTVKGRLTVKAGGSITGAIAYKELAVEAGAQIDGKISPLDAHAKASSSNRKVSGKKTQNAADAGAELPFESKSPAAA